VKIGAVILAAGLSKRMGQPKQLLMLGSKPLFRYAVDLALHAQLSPVVVIGGKEVGELRTHCNGLPVEVLFNEEYATGMASSLKLGIHAVGERADAAMIFLADQPLVPNQLVRQMIDVYLAHREKGIWIVRPEYKGLAGHPVLIDAQLYPQFERIQGDEGGKKVIKQYNDRLLCLPCSTSVWGADVDTPEDLQEIRAILH